MMDDDDFKGLVSEEVQSALNYYDTEFSQDRVETMEYYLGEPFGNEQEGRSQVVATEVSDTIEYIMPSIMKIFTSNDEFARFTPRTPEDVQAAEQASDLVNFVINSENPGFRILHNWFKDSLMFKMGVVKFYWEEEEDVTEEEYAGLSEEELAMLLSDESLEIVEQESIVEEVVDEMGFEVEASSIYNVKVRKRISSGSVKLSNIPPEELIFNRQATSLEDCTFVAHRSQMTVSDLVSMGYDRDLVEEYAGSNDLDGDEERSIRFGDLEDDMGRDSSDPTMRNVLVTEGYIRSDYDGDGIAELRRFVALGDSCEIVENEPWDVIPFAVLSPILMPHRMVGRSVAETVKDIQLIKSTVLRQMLDNLYLSNNSRVVAVEGQVNLDDLLTSRPGGIVRTRAPGMVQPLQVPQIGSQAFQMLGYMDEVRDQRTGFSKASMGLDPSTLQSTTASAVNATIQGAQAKVEMIARVFAETGCKQLAFGVLHLCQKHMSEEKVIRIRNQFVSIDPQAWDNKFDIQVEVGLGNGKEDQKVAMLAQIAGKQEQLLQQLGPNNPVVTPSQYINTLKKIAESAGFKDTAQFFNSGPEVEQAMAQQAQSQEQQGQDPQIQQMLELERAKAEADIQIKREKAAADMQLAREKMTAEMELRRMELQAEIELRQQKIAIDGTTSTNLPRV